MSVLSLIDVKGQLLIVPSTGTRVVINWSSRIGRLFDTDFNTFFAIFTNDSQASPIHGLLGRMKWHWIFQIDKLFVIVVLSKIFSNNFNSRFAPTKFWLFSLHILLGLPHLDVSLCNTVIKQSVLKSPANTIPFVCSCAGSGLFHPIYGNCNWTEIINSCVGQWWVKHCWLYFRQIGHQLLLWLNSLSFAIQTSINYFSTNSFTWN